MNQRLIYLQVPATPLPYTSYWNSTKWLLNNSYKYTGVIRVTVRKFKDFYQVLWKYFCFKNSEPYSYSKCHFLTFSIGQNWFHVKSDWISTLWGSSTPRKKNTSSGHFAGSNKSITAALLLNTSLAVHVFTQYILMDENYSVIPIKYILEYLYQAM